MSDEGASLNDLAYKQIVDRHFASSDEFLVLLSEQKNSKKRKVGLRENLTLL